MMIEIPSDDEVVDALASINRSGARITARALCDNLVSRGHPVRESQIAIQRAAERGRILVNSDWSLSAIQETLAA